MCKTRSSEEIMMFTMALVVYSLLVGIAVLVAMLLVSRFARHRALVAPLRKIPGPKPNILFGNVLQFPRPSHDGYVIPKGTAVGVPSIALHRNPQVWPEPLEFNPERFLPENNQGRHPYAFTPFSAGPRNCIGQRSAILDEKIVLVHVLRNFTIDSTQSYEELLICTELITRPREGIFVSLTKR